MLIYMPANSLSVIIFNAINDDLKKKKSKVD